MLIHIGTVENTFGSSTAREYQLQTISSENVREVEDPNCEVALLRHYQRTAKKSIWTFGLYTEDMYVFYVPEGTISKSIGLN